MWLNNEKKRKVDVLFRTIFCCCWMCEQSFVSSVLFEIRRENWSVVSLFACFLWFSKRSTTAKGVWEINSEQLVPIVYAFPRTLADYANAVISRFRSRLRHWHNPLVCEERHTRWALGVNCLYTPCPISASNLLLVHVHFHLTSREGNENWI